MKKRLYSFCSCTKEFIFPILYSAMFFMVFKSWKTDTQKFNGIALINLVMLMFNFIASYYSINSLLNNVNKLLLLSSPKFRNEKGIVKILAGEWEAGDKLNSYEKIYVIINKFYLLIFIILLLFPIVLAAFVSFKMNDINQFFNAYTYLNFIILLTDASISSKIEKNIKFISNSTIKARPNFLNKIRCITKRIKNKILDYSMVLLSVIMIISIIIIICFCDARVLPFFKNFHFLLMGYKDKTFYNIAISYFAAYIFYIMQVYLPEKNLEEKKIPVRAAIQREVQLFTIHIVKLCIDYYNYVISNGLTDKKIDKNIDSIFDEDRMMEVLNKINLSDTARKILNKNSNSTSNESWKNYIKGELDRIIVRGEKIVTYRLTELPPDIYYAITYLTTDSNIVCRMDRCIDIYKSNPKLEKEIVLAGQLIPKDTKTGKVDISTDMKSIKKLISWVNSECDYLHKQKKYKLAHIWKIDIDKLAKW